MNLSWIQLGSLLMFLGIVLGAFGGHALKTKLSPAEIEIYKTAVLYHLIHALALFIVAWLSTQSTDIKVQYAGLAFLTGVVLFSGTLYALAITEIKWLGFITPLGGFCFLAGWALLFSSQYTRFF